MTRPYELTRDLLRWLLLVVAVASPTVARSEDSPHLKMGNPSQASTNPSQKNNFLMVKPFYALSYNNVKGTPNWVSWRLSKEDLGTAPRAPFKPDTTLPSGFKRIQPGDYSNSEFDRVQMCPHSDRTKNAESSKATFLMTNMVPQSPENNQRGLEPTGTLSPRPGRQSPQGLLHHRRAGRGRRRGAQRAEK